MNMKSVKVPKKTVVVYRVTLSTTLLLLCALLSTTALSGCSSTSDSKKTFIMPDSDSGSTAHGAAFTGSAMFLRKPMPSHSDWQPQAFYYKVCDQVTAATYYSRTSYSCNER